MNNVPHGDKAAEWGTSPKESLSAIELNYRAASSSIEQEQKILELVFRHPLYQGVVLWGVEGNGPTFDGTKLLLGTVVRCEFQDVRQLLR